ncbi:MAG: exodeoxyribonuclease V subunit beta [Deltaproteobacteria bacterium]|nr:exodeoxyribonuclease V subunit beta [Deltaproteobacteria bacterium]
METFDAIFSPLWGQNLIEASAGTGKTYTISCLVVRAIATGNIPLEQILIVTFTRASCADLQKAVRERISQTLLALQGRDCQDDFAKKFALNLEDDHDVVALRLRTAMSNLDLANIFTIHGFCQRMLVKYAFESGSNFNFSVIENEEAIIREVATDYWRISTYRAPVELLAYLQKELSLKELITYAKRNTNNPQNKSQKGNPPPIKNAIDTLQQAFKNTSISWQNDGEAAITLLLEAGLNKRSHSDDKIMAAKSVIASFFTRDFYGLLPKEVGMFTTSKIAKAKTLQTKKSPEHSFFHECDKLTVAALAMEANAQEYLNFIRNDFAHYLHDELNKRKRELNVVSFDDIVSLFWQALNGAKGSYLQQKIANDFSIAFIDEFQDTDRRQCEIFARLFGDKSLFVVGDPKQSIYSFRGADIDAYIKMAGSFNKYFLKENWRSSADYVEALNILFSQTPLPFINEQIKFQKIVPARGNDPLLLDNKPLKPLALWYLMPTNNYEGVSADKTQLGKEEARDIIGGFIASEIAKLCRLGNEGRALLAGERLKPADIAIIVPNHRGADIMRDKLERLGIVCATQGAGNVFSSSAASDIRLLLAGVINYHSLPMLRAVLIKGGYSPRHIVQMTENISWEKLSERFAHYHRIWVRSGFGEMMANYLSEQNILASIAENDAGERRLTDFWHIVEILCLTEVNGQKSPHEMLLFLEREMDSANDTAEGEENIRIERDSAAVRIITIHSSKGLEFPVVFCPFLWDAPAEKRMPLTNDLTLVADEVSLANSRQERMRLLYVALTRAKYHCHFVNGAIKNGGNSQIQLLFPENCRDDSCFFKLAQENERYFSCDFIGKPFFPNASTSSDGCVPAPITLAPKIMPARIDNSWRIASFSSLASSNHSISYDYDDGFLNNPVIAVKGSRRDIFSFPRGAVAGNFFHSLIAEVDFTSRDVRSIGNKITEKLRSFGFEESWQGVILNNIKTVLSASLPASAGNVCLGDVGAEKRIVEMEFCFRFNKTNSKDFNRLLSSLSRGKEFWQEEAIDFANIGGFLKGFIDLVFEYGGRYYIVDWKSNHLGDEISCYNNKAMEEEMLRSLYHLQYIIYTVALHLFLKNRINAYDYEKHFGDVFYIFLRGIDAQQKTGIYHTRPSLEDIETLTQAFTHKQE